MTTDENRCDTSESTNIAAHEPEPIGLTGAQLDELGAAIVCSAGRISAASCAWLLQVAAFDAAAGHVRAGMASTAQWLGYACGLAARTACDHVRVANALAAHPALAAEMSAGRLSYSQVRAIARVARIGEPDLVTELIEVAQHGTVAHLEAIVRGLRTVEDNEQPREQADREHVRHRWADDSSWQLSARLDPERGALVATALDQLARVENLAPAQALVRLAELGIAALADTPGTSKRHLRGHEHAAVIIHLDATSLPAPDQVGSAEPKPRRQPRSAEPAATPTPTTPTTGPGSAEPDADPSQQRPRPPARPYARLQNGPGLPERVIRRLVCDGRIRTIVRDGTRVLDVGRSRRLATARQHRALLIRHHYHCATPGCANTTVDAHHVIHWLDGGPTDLTNLIPLCEPHHLGHHNGEMTITGHGDGTFTFTRPDGRPYLTALPDIEEPFPTNQPSIDDQYADLDPTAPTTHWDGQKLDLGYAIATLAHRRHQTPTQTEPKSEAS
ncbi:MAG: HNH endonuclease [Acidothermaceae bacterium]